MSMLKANCSGGGGGGGVCKDGKYWGIGSKESWCCDEDGAVAVEGNSLVARII